MSPAPTLLAACALAVVDRVEGPVAVLDWCGLARVDVPRAALPAGVGEGSRLQLVSVPPDPVSSPRVEAGEEARADQPERAVLSTSGVKP